MRTNETNTRKTQQAIRQLLSAVDRLIFAAEQAKRARDKLIQIAKDSK